MNEFDDDDMRERSNVDKLKRGVIESQIDLSKLNPLQLVHNKLARMVSHDATIGSLKVRPEVNTQSALRVLADTDAIHAKLFVQMKAGDGSQASGTE